MTEQPTEQWVQMFLRVATVAPAEGGGHASALRMLPSGRLPSAPSAPAATPDRLAKPRRPAPPLPTLASPPPLSPGPPPPTTFSNPQPLSLITPYNPSLS